MVAGRMDEYILVPGQEILGEDFHTHVYLLAKFLR
jgi:hypothetical protein